MDRTITYRILILANRQEPISKINMEVFIPIKGLPVSVRYNCVPNTFKGTHIIFTVVQLQAGVMMSL